MATSYSPLVVFAVIAVIGVGTFAIRFSFVALFGRLDEVPAGVERALRFVPAAVLAALVVPAIVTTGPETGALTVEAVLSGGLAVDKVVAGAIAVAVAWRTEDVFATMAAGMGALWLVRLVV